MSNKKETDSKLQKCQIIQRWLSRYCCHGYKTHVQHFFSQHTKTPHLSAAECTNSAVPPPQKNAMWTRILTAKTHLIVSNMQQTEIILFLWKTFHHVNHPQKHQTKSLEYYRRLLVPSERAGHSPDCDLWGWIQRWTCWAAQPEHLSDWWWRFPSPPPSHLKICEIYAAFRILWCDRAAAHNYFHFK